MEAWDRVQARPYEHDRDWWRVRHLLVDTYPATPPGFNWDVRRWDGLRCHQADLVPDTRWSEWFRVWETMDGRLVGIAHTEGAPGEVYLELHPDYRILTDDMLAWAEGALADTRPEVGARSPAFCLRLRRTPTTRAAGSWLHRAGMVRHGPAHPFRRMAGPRARDA